MAANRRTPDDAVSNLGSSVGGIHSEQRVRCKCPQANKSTISYAVVNNNGWPSHMIYQSYFQGEARYFIFECFCIHPNPKRPFGRRGNDFLEDAKKHLRAINHRDIVKEHRQFLQSQHIRVPPDYFVIEELGRLVRGCSAALANENNRQFCVDRFNHQNKTNLEKYCFYECESTRSGVPSPATAPPVALEHPEHEPFDPAEVFMHGALPDPSSEATILPVTNGGSRAVGRHLPAHASNADGPVTNNSKRCKTNKAVLNCEVCPPQARQRPMPVTGVAQVLPALRNRNLNSSRQHGHRGVGGGDNRVIQWLMGCNDSLE